MKAKYYFSTFIISNSKIEILVSFSRSTNVNVNMSFPNSNFEGNVSTYRDLKSECCKSRHLLCKKILNCFICVEVIILCKKVKYVWILHFPEAITTNMQIGYDSFVFTYPVTWQKNFRIHINFIEINVNVCLLCALHVMTSIILHTRRPNCQ